MPSSKNQRGTPKRRLSRANAESKLDSSYNEPVGPRPIQLVSFRSLWPCGCAASGRNSRALPSVDTCGFFAEARRTRIVPSARKPFEQPLGGA